MENDTKVRKKANKPLIIFVVILFVILFIVLIASGEKNDNNKIPDDTELLSYAQYVLDDMLKNPNYSYNTDDYNIVPPNESLRSKIEGEVEINSKVNDFIVIIEFVDNTYKEYDLEYLWVGGEVIYDSGS